VVQRNDLGAEGRTRRRLLLMTATTVHVRLFAGLQGVVGAREIEVSLDGTPTVEALRDRLAAEYPVLEAFLPTLVCAVDEEVVPLEHRLADGARVEVIPPISGG
jgi:molybdopterin converting factor small subunit